MLEVVNTYLHGFVAVPVLAVCRELGFFKALERGPVSVSRMIDALPAHPGYCRLVFRALHALGCVESSDRETYVLSDRFRHGWRWPDGIEELYRIDFAAYLFEAAQAERVEPWLSASARGWDSADVEFAMLLDGALMVPLWLELARRGMGQGPQPDRQDLSCELHPDVQPPLRRYLAAKDLIEPGGPLRLNQRGRYLCERALTMAVTASYKPLLLSLRELLCGDPARVLGRDADGHETYVDRTLNVIGSGFQHGKYFQDLVELVVEMFDRQPVEEQPKYIIDMGCGDGALLKTAYTAIVERSQRGRRLEQHPLLLVGVDFNEKSLQAAARTLAGTPHLLLHGDIAQPQALLDDLKAHGVSDVDAMLHIRSFLDHDRPIDLKPGAEDTPPRDDHVYVNGAGAWIDSSAMTRDLRDHLARWSGILGRHGLILLEVFALPVGLTREYFSQTESFSFDFYHALSKQALVDAGTFHQALASAGLYPDRESLLRYPRTTPFSRIVLQHVRPRPFVVRRLRLDDLPDLLAIDRACWPQPLRLSAAEIERRHRTFADGQFVLEYQQRVVGVLYTQRIDDLDRVLAMRHADYPDAHVDSGRYWQLLGISTHPEVQSLALGDQLLEHVLDLAALTAGVEAVLGITRCLAFRQQSEPMADYIHRRDASGLPLDPLLRFHHSHGAAIDRVVPGARPEDVDNDGAGVLIRYDLTTRLRGPRAGQGRAQEAGGLVGVLDTVAQSIRRLMKKPEAFAADRPLKELGLDSMGLMELRLLLQQAFGIEFEPAFFFTYTHAKAIAGFIAGQGQASSVTADVPLPGPVEAHRPAREAGQAASDVAIIGMALRFPGGIETPEAFWQLLLDQGCVITPRPAERWREYRSELEALPAQWQHIHQGGFLKDIEQFDAAFFHITPTEAEALDPQQRLLLELVWEALEHAGIDAHRLAGRPVGTFLGAYTHDHEALTLRQRALLDVDAYFGTGNALSAAAGRLAYFFDFRGPAVSIDTACSSSSSAVVAACQSLADGGSELAVAASVNMMIGPTLSLAFAKAGMLSPDGLCKTFDSSANGYVRSEGGAVLLLKRLEDALRDGDPVHAVIKSAALMQDGRTNGLTAPNGQAQVDVIRRALRLSQRSPAEVSYVEAHGTGTYLGDPVEMQALRSAYCDGVARSQPLCVGSVKTNLGHTEAVSGMAGLIKVVLAMRHGWIPAHLHVRQANEMLKLEQGGVEIALQGRPWQVPPDRPRLAGVSSFGFSGSNTHIVLEEFTAPPAAAVAGPGLWPAVVSAKSRTALRKNIAALSRYVEAQGERLDLAALSHTLTHGRAQHAHRVAFAFGSHDELRLQLNQADTERPAGQGLRFAFMFTGQGAQYPGMARRLAQTSRRFRAHLEHCAELVRRHAGFELFDVMWGAADPGRIHQTRYTQVALFCVEYALAELLREAGIRAEAVLGHSVGEFAAACFAGVMSLESTIRLLCRRGELMHERTRAGSMVALLAPLDQVEPLLRGFDQVAVAAMNGPLNQVIAGDPQQVGEIVRRAEQLGMPAFPLPVERAFHSPLMAPILAPFQQLAEEQEYAAPGVTLLSNVTGAVWTGPLTGQYWSEHVRLPVRFDASVRSLLASGVDVVVEIGPKPVLTRMAMAVAPNTPVRWLPSLLDAEQHGLAVLFTQASQAGLDVDWSCYPHESAAVLTDLPRYQFERQPYWITSASSPPERSVAPPAEASAPSSRALATFQQRVEPGRDGALWAHVIGSDSVFPASGQVALLVEAGLRWLKRPAGLVLTGLRLERMLRLEPRQAYQLELEVEEPRPSVLSLRLRGRPEAGGAWADCAHAAAEALGDSPGAADRPADGEVVLQGEDFYARLAALGYVYQAPFKGMRRIRRTGDTFVAEVSDAQGAPQAGYAATPWSLDSCFQTALAASLDALSTDAERLLLPVAVARLAWHAPLGAEVRVSCRCRPTPSGIEADLRIVDEHGRLCVEVESLAFAWVKRRGLELASAAAAVPAVQALAWRPHVGPVALAEADEPAWLILCDERGQGAALAEVIAGTGARVQRIALADLPAGAAAEAALMDRLAAQATSRPGRWGLVHAWPLDLQAQAAETARRQALDLAVMRFAATRPEGLSRVIVLTAAAQPVQASDVLAEADAAALWGLAASLRAETPALAVTLVDVATVPAGAAARRQAEQILRTPAAAFYAGHTGWPDDFALRDGHWHVRALTPAARSAPLSIRGAGSYVISGGLGGLGRQVAEFLHGQGAGRVLLLGRQTPAVGPDWVQALNRQRDCVRVAACDVTDRDQVATVVAAALAGWPVRGIVHAAGVVDDALLDRLDLQRLQAVCAPKLDGARHLLASVPAQGLDFVWLFSSVLGLFGGAGQANYAAANAALDAYAHGLRRRGVRALSINWGPWSDTGMTARLSQPELAFARFHAQGLEPQHSAALFAALLAVDEAQCCVVRWRPDLMRQAVRLPQLLRPLLAVPAEAPVPSERSLSALLEGALGEERRQRMRRFVASEIARITGLPPEAIDVSSPLSSLGMDSLMSVELRDSLSAAVGQPLSATLVFDHPTLDALAMHVLALTEPESDGGGSAAGEPPPETIDTELAEIESLGDEDLEALLGEEFIRE
ncbi:SDR family NAD(P)-dependent oxidoreductase [Aquabacterium sp. A7-Y]|uniref:type I polyketide synthase n=1 Tax=Aquabacterium sp. A7-Y TaxID=1349605 RepID=UPI00223E0756|nr:type I polyketide synthase [Aquabacterium sp. A7-Y]MCW7538531.1 SDR family NAD(P)-dependent oxidoreductase [Aquabacterium sp. A7-Y]